MKMSKARSIVNKAIRDGIMEGREGQYAMVYRNAGSQYPEGWYKEDIETVAKELMKDNNGLKLLNKVMI